MRIEPLSVLGAAAFVLLSQGSAVAGPWPPPVPKVAEGTVPKPPITAINPKDGAVMIFVPAGDFLMGSTKAQAQKVVQALPAVLQSDALRHFAAEEPQHKVYLDGYWIYRDDVTVADYRKFCDATGRQIPQPPDWAWKYDNPAVSVSWDDAKAYCDWAGVALPTEAQWEKAARGTDGRIYPWGNSWDKTKANSDESALNATTPVGNYSGGASPYGCMDMAGNVFQWCADRYDKDYYGHSPVRNPTGPVARAWRVLRGGSWDGIPDYCRSALRNYSLPTNRSLTFGFRCAGPAGMP